MKRSLLVLALVACGPPETAVRVRVELAPGVVAQQLRFTGTSGGTVVFGPELRPEVPAGTLQSGGELLVLLPDRLDQRELVCGVGAMSGAQLVAWNQSTVRIHRGAEQECVVTLSSAPAPQRPPCKGCWAHDGKCKAGDRDDDCGTGGAACMKCEHGAKCKSGRCME